METAVAEMPAVTEAKPVKQTVTITAPLRQVCDPEGTRYALNAVQFKRTNAGCFLAATNGKIAAVVRCTATAQENTLIPREALPVTLPKSTKWKDRSYRVEKDGKRWFGEVYEGNHGQASGMRVAYEVDGRFPKIGDVFGECGPVAVTLNVNELAKLAEAVSGNGEVTLYIFPDDKDSTKGVNVYGDRGIGKIMCVHNADEAGKRRMFAEHVKEFQG